MLLTRKSFIKKLSPVPEDGICLKQAKNRSTQGKSIANCNMIIVIVDNITWPLLLLPVMLRMLH